MGMPKDRRIQRTRALLRTALLELVQEKGFESLSVQEITDRANVGRTTFYAHFDGKEALLLAGFDDLHEQLHRQYREVRARSVDWRTSSFGFGREMFEHVAAYRDVFQYMAGKPSGDAVLVRLKRLLIELVRDEVKRTPSSVRTGDASREVSVQFIAGALFNLLEWWLHERAPLTSVEMDRAFRQMAESALRAGQLSESP